MGLCQEQGEVEEAAPKVGLKLDGLTEPELGLKHILLVRRQHAEVEEDLLIFGLEDFQLYKSLSEFEAPKPELLDDDGSVEKSLWTVGVDIQSCVNVG